MATVAGACGGAGGTPPAECEEGTERCPCYPNDSCNDDLACLSGVCVDPNDPDPPGRGGNSSRGGSSSSDGGDETGNGGVGDETGGNEPGQGGDDQPGQGGNGDPGQGGSGNPGQGGSSNPGQGGTTDGGEDGGGPTPVDIHGALSVSGTDLIDASGGPVKLEGMSSMWLNWDTMQYAQSREGLRWMRDNWNLRLFRAAMGVEPEGAYLEDPETAKAAVNRIVQNAIDLGVYVIIDWHDHEALSHQGDAVAFFDEMSAAWGDYPNVIYEVFNEPLDLDWSSQLKPYHETLVATIRANDPDNIIVLGTPNWDQDVDVAAADPLSGSNLMYTLHFYACSHQADMRSKAITARNLGLPMFVTEWGATPADGGAEDRRVCEADADAWHQWLDQNNMSWAAWKLDGCADTSCMFVDQTAPVDGPWTSEWLNGHANYVISEMMTDIPSNTGGTTGTGGTSGQGGTTGEGGTLSGTGGSDPVDNFPPDPAGCALLVSCPSCCETTGAYAVNAEGDDYTDSIVTGFGVTASAASASYDFPTSGMIGGIFFRLASEQDIGSLGVSITYTGGYPEVALVNSNGANGCIYPIVGDTIYPTPDTCWGTGAGPWYGIPADQIDVRVVSSSSGVATLSVAGVDYGP